MHEEILLVHQRRCPADLAQRQALRSGFDLQLRPGDEIEAIAKRLRHHHSPIPVDGNDNGIMVGLTALLVKMPWRGVDPLDRVSSREGIDEALLQGAGELPRARHKDQKLILISLVCYPSSNPSRLTPLFSSLLGNVASPPTPW